MAFTAKPNVFSWTFQHDFKNQDDFNNMSLQPNRFSKKWKIISVPEHSEIRELAWYQSTFMLRKA